ncbi:hypothetical protein MKY91_20420 [Alkalicoccobacillus gibsonii]|uniref:Uncharacterized protein n=1 Tax=Alkalicoccobacillus gibsonii TaxID=79881 RepID=A0ABU9VNP6_9BACI
MDQISESRQIIDKIWHKTPNIVFSQKDKDSLLNLVSIAEKQEINEAIINTLKEELFYMIDMERALLEQIETLKSEKIIAL